MAHAERRSFMRAAAAAFIGHRDRADPVKVLRSAWADDSAERVLKAAVAPSGTGDFRPARRIASAVAGPVERERAPVELGDDVRHAWLFDLRVAVDPTNTIPPPVFMGEGLPIPLVDLTTAKTILGPARKLAVLAAFTSELQAASAPAAESIIGQALGDRDREGARRRAIFGQRRDRDCARRAVAWPRRDASAGGSGVEGLADDLGLLAAAIGW